MRDSGGTGFWHEAYFARGGIEAMYDDMDSPTGLAASRPPSPPEAGCSPPAAGSAERIRSSRRWSTKLPTIRTIPDENCWEQAIYSVRRPSG
ncbi:hypothetical protein [Nocardia transvalensis]|uniref:hypothetical protein n=1 Tax=Nocardia transvalensis TaxID=37333 RepID=UPI002B4B325E|nr:hypothetical protein [Nocardia transvalensis]